MKEKEKLQQLSMLQNETIETLHVEIDGLRDLCLQVDTLRYTVREHTLDISQMRDDALVGVQAASQLKQINRTTVAILIEDSSDSVENSNTTSQKKPKTNSHKSNSNRKSGKEPNRRYKNS